MKNYELEIMVVNSAIKNVKDFVKEVAAFKREESRLELIKPETTDKRSKEWRTYTRASEPILAWKKAILAELPEKANLEAQLRTEVSCLKKQIKGDFLLALRKKKREDLLSQLERF